MYTHVHVRTHTHNNYYFLVINLHVYVYLDCTDIALDGWIQNLLLRRSSTPPGSDAVSSRAPAEAVPSAIKAVTTFREDGEHADYI